MPIDNFDGWDPLHNLSSSSLINSMVKKNIRNIISSYTGQYDLINELIQNALDSLEKRWSDRGEFSPKIHVKIDLKKNEVTVSDNGVGFRNEEFKSFLAPDISFKSHDAFSRGHKGVGATYIGYGYDKVWIETKNSEIENRKVTVQFFEARKWVDSSEDLERPGFVVLQSDLSEFLDDEDSGATFKVSIDGQKRPNLNYLGATEAKQWEMILRAQTPLGYIKLTGSDPMEAFRRQTKINIIVIDSDGHETESNSGELQYFYPHEVQGRIKDLDELIDERSRVLSLSLDISRVSSEFKNCDGIYNIWSAEEILNTENDNPKRLFKNISESEIELIQKHNISAYAFYVSSTDIWKDISFRDVGIRRDSKIVWGGLHISADRMLQGQKLDIPLTKNIGLQQQVHILIHLDDGEPDMGRKVFQPHITDICKRISTQIVTRMMQFRFPFIQIADTSGIASRVALENFKNQMIVHSQNKPLIIPFEEVKSLSEPIWEQGVVALFNQLIALNILKGYEVYATASHSRYDGLLNINYYSEDKLKYNGDENYLGIKWEGLQEGFSIPAVLEFKHDFDNLIDNFNKDEKDPSEIDLVIAWHSDNLNHQAEYELRPLFIDKSIMTERRHYGSTHTVYNGSQRLFDVILLKDLIFYFNNQNDLDAVFDQQRRYLPTI